jgi:hypothetical protein
MFELKEMYISPDEQKLSAQEKNGYKKSTVRLFHNDNSEYMLVGVMFPFRKGLILNKTNVELN